MLDLDLSNKPESLVVKLRQDVEEGEWGAVKHPVRRRRWIVDIHRQSSVEKLQTQLNINRAVTYRKSKLYFNNLFSYSITLVKTAFILVKVFVVLMSANHTAEYSPTVEKLGRTKLFTTS